MDHTTLEHAPRVEAETEAADASEGPVLRQTNRGSAHHPNGCKPCNKFNPERADSCKHGQDCEFCHEKHERPKHRGQRGRHALQRRQYLETRDEQEKWFVELVDKIYKAPFAAVEQVKRKLPSLQADVQKGKVLDVIDRIRDIGERAQHSRPDNTRLRGQRITIADGSATLSAAITELDGRCKWLVGTLHLMVRKMKDAKETEANIGQVVSRILQQCEELPEILDRPDEPFDSAMPRWIQDLTTLDSGPTWFSHHLAKLAMNEPSMATSDQWDDEVAEKIQECKRLNVAKLNEDRWRDCILSYPTLSDLSENISQVLMDMAVEELSQTVSEINTKEDLLEWCEDKSTKDLPEDCKFLTSDLLDVLRKELDAAPQAPLTAAQTAVENILQECQKLPEQISVLSRFLPDEGMVKDTVRKKLLPSDSLVEFHRKLAGLTGGPAP